MEEGFEHAESGVGEVEREEEDGVDDSNWRGQVGSLALVELLTGEYWNHEKRERCQIED